jgi:hypothetical protein
MFGRYQLDTTNDTDVPWGQRIPWMEMVLPPIPAMNVCILKRNLKSISHYLTFLLLKCRKNASIFMVLVLKIKTNGFY